MAQNALLVLVSVLLGVGLMEGVVRGVGFRRPLRPYQRVTHRTVGGERQECFGPEISRPYYARHHHCVGYPSNNQALRRRGPTAQIAPPGTYRVLGLGSSFLYGFGVFQEDTFFERIEKTLNEGAADGLGNAFEWLNAAVPGSNTSDALQLYEKRGRGLSPDLVVLGINLFSFVPFPTSFLIDPGQGGRRNSSPLFHLWDWLSYRWDVRRQRQERIETIRGRYSPDALKQYVDVLESFHQKLRGEGRSLLILFFPIFYDFENYAFTSIHESLGRSLDDKGIAHLDFLRFFQGERASDFWITLFDQHPNEMANDRFYRATLDFVRSGNLRIPFSFSAQPKPRTGSG